MRTEIYGKGIILKAYQTNFARLLYEAVIESCGGEFSYWMPWSHENYKIEESREFIAKVIKERDQKTEFAFAIFDTETNKFLGGIGLNQPNYAHRFYNLGYWVRTSEQKRGAASVATRALAQAAFEDLPINRIEILAAIENIPSHKTAEKAGATREGVLRKRLVIGGRLHDAVIFSFVRDDFQTVGKLT